MLIRSGEAQLVGWSRYMLYLGLITLPRSVVRRQTGFAARITRTLSRLNLGRLLRSRYPNEAVGQRLSLNLHQNSLFPGETHFTQLPCSSHLAAIPQTEPDWNVIQPFNNTPYGTFLIPRNNMPWGMLLLRAITRSAEFTPFCLKTSWPGIKMGASHLQVV